MSSLDRRTLLAGAGVCAIASTVPTRALAGRPPGLAVTIDDFDLADTVLMDGEARDDAIRAHLRRHAIKGAGFVAGKYVDAIRSPRVLRRWSDGGHLLGNHSFSHDYFDGSDPDALMADILRCERLLSGYASFRRLFRFPYLAEGKTSAGRDAMRALLGQHGYRNAPVTIDTSDWAADTRLRARLAADPRADLAPYRRFYLDHLWSRATYYDRLARTLVGASIDHTLLLHHRLSTALFLGDALAMFRARGWRLVNADRAFAAPVLAREPDSLPAGQSLLWGLAKADGRFAAQLRFPGEDGGYEAPKMDALGL